MAIRVDDYSHDSGDYNLVKIIVDEPAEEDALDFQLYSQNLANIIRGTTPPQFAVGIFGKWGTGKTTLMTMIEKELDKDNEKILTVWFDAWRYEREKYLAVIPFLRQIRIALENELAKNKKTKRWDKLKVGLERTIAAFIQSIEVSIDVPGSPVSGTINTEKFANSWKSIGSTYIDGEHIQFHEHVTDYLKNALDELYNGKDTKGARIVVFVDDLDRCTPEKALEVLESIKAFFDIKGIVYVIGMDSESINHIIKQKYGEHSNIKGIDYLQKIVQLPFQIPVWKPEDITGYIEKIISKGLEGSKLAKKFEEENRKSLIVKAIEPNPRQVKRFVNNIILANRVFSKPDKKIEIDKLIAVQALNFRSEWNRFLELITPDPIRRTFFQYYYVPLKEAGKVINSKDALDNFRKENDNDKKPLPEAIMGIFQELINQKDDTLGSFLDAGADKILRDIERMEDYRRALEATKFKEEEEHLNGKQGPTQKLLLELLSASRVEEFNYVRRKHHIYPDLSHAKLSHAKLSLADLSHAKLSGATLSNADLSKADLYHVDLSHAKLSHADLSTATLSQADLSQADLSWAKLSGAILSGATLSSADLSQADLSHAKLSGATLSNADLSEADLSEADLSNVDLSNVDLSRARNNQYIYTNTEDQ